MAAGFKAMAEDLGPPNTQLARLAILAEVVLLLPVELRQAGISRQPNGRATLRSGVAPSSIIAGSC